MRQLPLDEWLDNLNQHPAGANYQAKSFEEELLNPHPLSHTHDPITSYAAERSIRDSGALETHNKLVAWLVARYPGRTASELWDLAIVSDRRQEFYGWDLQEIRRRLTTNMPAHVYQGEARIGLRKKREVTWFPK